MYTAVDWPRREKRFDLVAQLYSFSHNARLRLKIPLGAGEQPATLVPIWPVANWLEREIFDLFGIVFRGHPKGPALTGSSTGAYWRRSHVIAESTVEGR